MGIVSTKMLATMRGGSWIRRMFDRGNQLKKEHGEQNVFDYTLGNPSVNPPPEIEQRLRDLVKDPEPGLHAYMPNAGYESVREYVAEHVALHQGLTTPLTKDHIVMTCGAGGALNCILKAILEPGEEVVALAPFFVEYKYYVDNHGGKLVWAQTREDFQPDLGAVEQAFNPRTKALLINSPNNPTGAVYPRETLEQLQVLIRRKEQEFGHPVLLISDEPYAKLVYDGVDVPPILKIFPHSVLATSNSKDLALPGERIGFLAISPLNEDAADIFEAVTFANRTLGFVNPVALMQRLIMGNLHLVTGVGQYRERRDLLFSALTMMGYQIVKPQGAFYMFPKSPDANDVEFCAEALKHLLLIVPGTGFGRPGYFRLSFSSIQPGQIVRSLPAFQALAQQYGLS